MSPLNSGSVINDISFFSRFSVSLVVFFSSEISVLENSVPFEGTLVISFGSVVSLANLVISVFNLVDIELH